MVHVSRPPERFPPGNLTYEDYVALPDDGRRYEILAGDLAMSPAPGPRHQRVVGNLFFVLHGHVQERELGFVYHAPIDVILARDSVVQPDLVLVAAGRESIITERAIEGPPDLAVEVVSPDSDRRDRIVKPGLYARHGVPHYWIVDPVARTLETYEAEGEGYRRVAIHEATAMVRAPLFPDLEIDLARVWV
jgi:Uma2 family endonuclease